MDIINNVNHVYVLNLDRYYYKWEKTVKELQRVELYTNKVSRWEAYDAFKNLPMIKEIQNTKKRHIPIVLKKFNKYLMSLGVLYPEFFKNRYLRPGEIGNYLSFYRMFKNAIKNNYESIIIFEDDISFNENFFNIDEVLKSVPSDWNIIFLGMSKAQTKFKKINDNINVPLGEDEYNGYRGTFAVIYKLNAVKKIFNEMKPMKMPIDVLIGYLYNKKIIDGVYSINPSVVVPDYSFSTTYELNA